MLLRLLIFCTMNLLPVFLTAQQVKVIDFKYLEPYLQPTSDTIFVINFWSTWCKPCVEELPIFASAETALKSAKVKFIMVSIDFSKNINTQLIPFLKKNKVPGQVLLLKDLDYDNWIGKINESWDGTIPATVISTQKERIFIGHAIADPNELLGPIKSLLVN